MSQPTSQPPPSNRRRLAWAGGLVALWLAGSAVGFWWFTMKDLRSFTPAAELGARAFDGATVAAGLEAAMRSRPGPSGDADDTQVTVLHFWDRDCACSRFNQTHVRDLARHYESAGVRFVVMDRSGKAIAPDTLSEAFGDAVESYAGDADALSRLGVPVSPAAAVFGRDGRLAYFGPYSEGAACLAGNGDFVEQVLDKLLAGEQPRQINTAAFGCFCNWTNHS